jgi:hypothetical protein
MRKCESFSVNYFFLALLWPLFPLIGAFGDRALIKANLSTLKDALKSGAIKWYWNKDRFRKYGGKDSTTLKAYIMDCNYNSILDLQLEVTKNIQ